MNRQKVFFSNAEGEKLVGRLELPVDRHPHNFVIFAHCFTCTKNLGAVRNISRALSSAGFGVLRFDFTGLGESQGDFANTNFSGNVADLESAARYLEAHYQAPALLVGHSLGGAAVVSAASKLPSVKAVATIGAPSDPSHVTHLLRGKLDEIGESGKARVNIGGRDFTIKRQFLDDLRTQSEQQEVGSLERALLILHSPQDLIVSIKNAEQLYRAAKHPKSFVSLDGADHLLSSREDSMYAGKVIAQWAHRYLDIPAPVDLDSTHDVVASLDEEDAYTTYMMAGNHRFVADEPVKVGGNDFGPTPYDLVSAGLSACTAMTLQMYARRKGWSLDNVEVHTSYSKEHAQDSQDCEREIAKLDTFSRSIKLEGDLNEKQRQRLLEIADRCPVHKTLVSAARVITSRSDQPT